MPSRGIAAHTVPYESFQRHNTSIVLGLPCKCLACTNKRVLSMQALAERHPLLKDALPPLLQATWIYCRFWG